MSELPKVALLIETARGYGRQVLRGHVVRRRSTDMVAISDADVAGALTHIHDHATEQIAVDDVVRHSQISRRNLEIRFQSVVGRALHAELQRVRVERARQFLIETELPVPEIATAVSYSTASYFIQVFRKQDGTTPARYRRDLQTGGS